MSHAGSLPMLAASLPCRLDEVVDAHALTLVLLEVMPHCSKSVQQGVLDLLPELVLEEGCEVTSHLCGVTHKDQYLLCLAGPCLSNCTSFSAAHLSSPAFFIIASPVIDCLLQYIFAVASHMQHDMLYHA